MKSNIAKVNNRFIFTEKIPYNRHFRDFQVISIVYIQYVQDRELCHKSNTELFPPSFGFLSIIHVVRVYNGLTKRQIFNPETVVVPKTKVVLEYTILF